MKTLFSILLLLSFASASIAQTDIPLTNKLNKASLEYSGLCKLRSWILLMPQYPEKNGIYGVDSNDIKTIVTKRLKSELSTYEWKVIGLEEIRKRIKGYEGFEAITSIDTVLFCTIETNCNNDTCYIIRGVASNNTIEFNLQSLYPILKLKKDEHGFKVGIDNAGFESLTYIKKLNQLLVLFEYNKYPVFSNAFLIDTGLTKTDTINMQSIDFRLTDICEGNDQMLYAINHHYHGDYYAYMPDTAITKKDNNLYDWTKESYSSIVKIDITKQNYVITPHRIIAPSEYNWEGIVPFYNGFLLVTDEYPGSKLVYFDY